MPKDALAQAATAPAVVEKKEDDTPVLEQPKTWKTLGISICWNILYILCFAVIMANFIYFKTLNKEQLNYMFPTGGGGEISGGGKIACDNYPSSLTVPPVWDQDNANDSLSSSLRSTIWPGPENYRDWDTLNGDGDAGAGFFWGKGFKAWVKITTGKSYNTLRGWLKDFLGSGFNKTSPSIWNNMFFQGFLFLILHCISGILSILVTFWHCIMVDPFWGIFFGWILWISIPVIQAVQLFVTFPTIPIPPMGFIVDSKLNGFKTIKKILECNIPTLIFLFALNIILTFSGVVGGGAAVGMWVWFIYATYRKTK
jgi:hypothetical protein